MRSRSTACDCPAGRWSSPPVRSKQFLDAAPDGAFGGDITYQLEPVLPHFAGRDVAVIGGGDSGTLDALELARRGSTVKLIHRSPRLSARRDIRRQLRDQPRIEELPGWELEAADGAERLEKIVLVRPSSGERQEIAVQGLVVKIARGPNTQLFDGQLDLDRSGAVVVDRDLRTSRAGVFAVGDVVSGAYARVAAALGARFAGGAIGLALPRRTIVSSAASSSDDDLPTSEQVVAEFRRALGDPEHRPTRSLDGRLLDLLRSNLDQWNLEDNARGPGADDAAVAQAKRAIDQLNAGRHRIVEEIDAAIDRAVTQTASAPLATESPAMAFDRLSVLVIRIHHTERAAGEEAAEAGGYAGAPAGLVPPAGGPAAGDRRPHRRRSRRYEALRSVPEPQAVRAVAERLTRRASRGRRCGAGIRRG